MPNRIIKESICTSDNIDQLTAFEETVFYRLMVNCDDFGRFDGRAKILSARLFPLKQVTPEEMETALDSLVSADLVTLYMVDGKPFVYLNSWDKHQQTRASKSKYPPPSEGEIPAHDITCNQMISNDIKCPRNRIRNRNTIIDNRNRYSETDDAADEGFIDDEEARKIQGEHDRVLNAAEDAGFKTSNSVRAKLLKLYAEHGLEKMLSGFDSCVKHGVTNLAYLEACLNGSGQKKPAGKDHGFTERVEAYEHIDEMNMKAMAYRITEGLSEEEAQKKARQFILDKYGKDALG